MLAKGARGRNMSIGLVRADNLNRRAGDVEKRAIASGHKEAADLASTAGCCAFSSRNGYEAAQLIDRGGDSEAWALRSRGAVWLKKGERALAKAIDLLDQAQ